MKRIYVTGLCAALAVLYAVSCSTSIDPRVGRYRESVLLPEEPLGAVTIEDARKTVSQDQEITLIGKVGNKDVPTWWWKDRAQFVISEGFPGSEYNVGPDHDPSTCPFCRNRWKHEDSMATIELVDDEGQTIPLDAITLLEVQEGDFVVVRGHGRLNELGILEVQADGVYLRQDS